MQLPLASMDMTVLFTLSRGYHTCITTYGHVLRTHGPNGRLCAGITSGDVGIVTIMHSHDAARRPVIPKGRPTMGIFMDPMVDFKGVSTYGCRSWGKHLSSNCGS